MYACFDLICDGTIIYNKTQMGIDVTQAVIVRKCHLDFTIGKTVCDDIIFCFSITNKRIQQKRIEGYWTYPANGKDAFLRFIFIHTGNKCDLAIGKENIEVPCIRMIWI